MTPWKLIALALAVTGCGARTTAIATPVSPAASSSATIAVAPTLVPTPATPASVLPHQPIDTAVELAWANDAKLGQLELNARVATRLEAGAGLVANPELRLGDDLLHVNTGKDGYAAAVRWNPPRPGQLAAEDAVASGLSGQARMEAERRRSKLAAFVRLAYVDTIMLGRLAGVEAQRVALERERAAVMERLIALGTRNLLDRTAARLHIAEAGAKEGKLRLDLNRRREELEALVGRTDLNLALPDFTQLATRWEELRAIAMTARPELAASVFAEQEASARSRLAAQQAWPWFSFVQVGVGFDRDLVTDGGQVQIGIEVPVSANGAAQRAAALEQVTFQQRERERLRLQATAALDRAHATFVAALAARRTGEAEIAAALADVDMIIASAAAQGGDPLALADLRLDVLSLQVVALEREWEVARTGVTLLRVLRSPGAEVE